MCLWRSLRGLGARVLLHLLLRFCFAASCGRRSAARIFVYVLKIQRCLRQFRGQEFGGRRRVLGSAASGRLLAAGSMALIRMPALATVVVLFGIHGSALAGLKILNLILSIEFLLG